MRYKQIEYRMGAAVEIIKCVPKKARKEWGAARKKTKEEIRSANARQAARKLERKLNANFRPGDYHVVLTYKDPPSPEEAKKNIDRFIARLRGRYQRRGLELKYILVTEYRRKRIHHHIVLNNVSGGKSTMDMIREAWKGFGRVRASVLYEEGEYSQLADYLIKETEQTFRDEDSPVKQRYSCSRNLVDPKPETRLRKVRTMWELDPRPRPGYYIVKDSLYNGFDLFGYPYQRYVQVKLNPRPEDWPQKEERHGTNEKKRDHAGRAGGI